MSYNVQLAFAGISVGCVYALVALGFVLIYRATNVVNFAQGDFAMVAAFFVVTLFTASHLPYWVSFLLVLLGMLIFGVVFELAVYFPLRNRSFMPVIISTLGASIFLENSALRVFGPAPLRVRGLLPPGGLRWHGVYFDNQYLAIIGLTVLLVIGQYLVFERTVIGKKLQATSQDKDMARLLGIPVSRMIALTFAYSAALGGLAGMLVAPIIFVSVGMGSSIALKAFAASIIGGFGNVTGAIVGGLLLGLAEQFGSAYISLAYRDAYGFLLLILFLLVRPHGIFGEKVGEKA